MVAYMVAYVLAYGRLYARLYARLCLPICSPMVLAGSGCWPAPHWTKLVPDEEPQTRWLSFSQTLGGGKKPETSIGKKKVEHLRLFRSLFQKMFGASQNQIFSDPNSFQWGVQL